ncbi:hypothetical protein F5Y08DRAFT_348106 [Xylaria arbuscula]|nr:hypothetical protein F5Y08DRAFT_348106 [Xylaria arbuscula]
MKFFLATLTVALASFALAADPVADAVVDSAVDIDAANPTFWPPSRTTTTTPSFTITVTQLPTTTSAPGKPPVPPLSCPTVTLTTRPSNCSPIRCPIPGCTYEQDMVIPCGCAVRTLLWVEGCQTACPEGCATRTTTLSQLCATSTGLAVPTAV